MKMATTNMHAGAGAAGDAKFWDRVAGAYAKRPVADEAAYQAKLTKIREALTPQSKVLEFGCGTGSTALALAPYAGSIRATDISPRMIEIAEAKRRAAGASNVVFKTTDFAAQTLAPESVDMVLGMSILHLMRDWRAAIAKSRVALKPGGRLATSTACLSGKMGWLRPILWAGRMIGRVPDVVFISEETLRAELERQGFEIEFRSGQKGPAVFMIARKPG